MNQTAQDYVDDMTDAELVSAIATARDDLAKAAIDAPNSEWHEACFAGALVLCLEAQKRGIVIGTRH